MVVEYIFVMGVAGSGKTTVGQLLAERIGAEFIDADDYHSAENREKMKNGIPLNDQDRLPWLQQLAEVVVSSRRPLVLACSALKPIYRKVLCSRLSAADNFTYLYLNVPRSQLEVRLKKRRGHFADERLLDSQLSTLSFEKDETNICPVDASGGIEETVHSALNALKNYQEM